MKQQAATKQYADIRFLYRNGSHPMTGDLNMNSKRIINLPNPTQQNEPATKDYTDTHFLNVDGKTLMQDNLNKKYSIYHLQMEQINKQQKLTQTEVIFTLMKLPK